MVFDGEFGKAGSGNRLILGPAIIALTTITEMWSSSRNGKATGDGGFSARIEQQLGFGQPARASDSISEVTPRFQAESIVCDFRPCAD